MLSPPLNTGAEMARAGRKRDINAKRRETTRKGRGETERNRNYRLEQIRMMVTGDASAPVTLESPIQVMAHHVCEDLRIDGLQYGAGSKLATLRHRIFGLPSARSCVGLSAMVSEAAGALKVDFGGPSAEWSARMQAVIDEDPDAADALAERSYSAALHVLAAQGRGISKTTLAVVIDGVWPRALVDWVWRPTQPVDGNSLELQMLRAGLDALVDHWHMRGRR